MNTGVAMYRLLRRPVTLAWIPLAALIAISATAFASVIWIALGERAPGPGVAFSWTFAALIGLLVGQAINEAQHCQFAWMLPRLRSRLFPGALVLGLIVSLGPREIASAVAVLAYPFVLFVTGNTLDVIGIWESLGAVSVGAFAISFMFFWIGVRPSAVNLIGVAAPVVLLIPFLDAPVASYGALALVLSAPLTTFLIYDTFSTRAARARPFRATRPLSGGASAANRKLLAGPQPSRLHVGRNRNWRFDRLDRRLHGWIRAGWLENHGHWGTGTRRAAIAVAGSAYLALSWMVLSTVIAAPEVWLQTGFGRQVVIPRGVVATMGSIIIASIVAGVPIAVFFATYASISLRRAGFYPLSRQRLAAVEYWGSLFEAALVCGLLAAIFLGFWMFVDLLDADRVAGWPRRVGGENGFVLALLRPLALIFVVIPVAQYFRLRRMRNPKPWSPVAQLLGVFGIATVLSWMAAFSALSSIWILPRHPLSVHAAVFLAAGLLSQYIYRQEVDRYFRTADLA